tara:strand:- start:3 stop:323 length:321 start_codon:yes stop_codon:yes gene_type:complete
VWTAASKIFPSVPCGNGRGVTAKTQMGVTPSLLCLCYAPLKKGEFSMYKQAYSIPDFLEAYSLSRSALYRLWGEHRGPSTIHIGRKVIILVEDATAWAKQMKTESA